MRLTLRCDINSFYITTIPAIFLVDTNNLDLQSRMDSPFKDYVLSYIDEEEPDGSENYDANPIEVTAEGNEYTLKIVSSVREGQRTYLPED